MIRVSLSGNKTTCPEMTRVKLVFDGINFFQVINIYQLLWAIDSEAMRARGIIVFVKSI